MSLDVRDILSLNEPAAKRPKIESIQAMSTANSDPKDILSALENDETMAEDDVELDETAAKKLCLQLDKRLKKNEEMRVKHAGDPEKFMQSEIDLNMAVQEMHAVAANPSLYGKMVDMGVVQTLIQLLAHENTDIVGAVCHLLQELCDIEILSENDETAAILIDELLKNKIIERFVTQVLARLNGNDTDEESAIHNVFSTMESILDFRPQAAELCIQEGLFVELMNRATVKAAFDPNKLYASQLLSVVLQTSDNAKAKLVEKKDGIDFLLRALASYKRRDPETADETEHMENLFDSLCAALLRKENRVVFLKDEGNELMYIMLKEKKVSREGALRVLSHVTAVPDGVENCDHFVEIFGLRALFPLFMKTPSKTKKKDTPSVEHEEHVVSIIEALLYSCSTENRKRVLAKFSESDCEKVDRLVELFLSHSDRLRKYMLRLKKQGIVMDDDELYAERLNNGFYTLSKIALILTDVCISSYHVCKERASNLFRMKTKNTSVRHHVEPILVEMLNNLGEEAQTQRERIELMISQLKLQENGPEALEDRTPENGSPERNTTENDSTN